MGSDVQMFCAFQTETGVGAGYDDGFSGEVCVGDVDATECLPGEHFEDFAEWSHIVRCGSGCFAVIMFQLDRIYKSSRIHINHENEGSECDMLVVYVLFVDDLSGPAKPILQNPQMPDHSGRPRQRLCLFT